jgi:hypothetical protein
VVTTPSPTPVRPIPAPGFIAACTVSTWLDPCAPVVAGPLAWLLLGHAPPRRPDETAEGIEDGLLGMAGAMRLRPARERVPHVGDRLITRRETVALTTGTTSTSCGYRTPATNGACTPRAGCPSASRSASTPREDAVDAYIRQAAARGTVLMGATGVRSRFGRPDTQPDQAPEGAGHDAHSTPGHPVTAAVLLTNAQRFDGCTRDMPWGVDTLSSSPRICRRTSFRSSFDMSND